MYLSSGLLFVEQLKRKTDIVNQIDELNTGLLQTPLPAKGGKAKKSSRSVKANAGESWTEMLCVSYLPTQTTVIRLVVDVYLYVLI